MSHQTIHRPDLHSLRLTYGRLLLWLSFPALACASQNVLQSETAEPDTGPTPDSVPAMVPDPSPTLPELWVQPPTDPAPFRPPADSVRVQRLLAVARAVRSDANGALEASNLLEEALTIDSGSPDVMWELGWSYYVLGRWDDAHSLWSRLRRQSRNYPGLSRYLPIAEMRRDRINLGDSVEASPRSGDRVSFSAVGDIQMGSGWPEDQQRLPPDSATGLFSRVEALLRHSDVTFGNLETVLADTGASSKCRRGSGNCYAFRAPTVFAHTLRGFGFDVMSTNNNHASDFGELGRVSTVASLDAALIKSAGNQGPASFERNGLDIALLAFSTGDGPYRVQDIAGAVRSVRDANRDHDIVVVSFHGGAEGRGATRVPREEEYAFGENRGDVFRFARSLVDAGADLILGHGPHVLRGMELYRGRLIAYSLGNFSAWHGFNLQGPSGLSVVLEVSLAPNGVVTDAIIHPLMLEPPGIPTPDANRQGIAIVRELSRLDFGDPLFDETGRLVLRP